MSSPVLTRLSQGDLNLLATCPRKFQHFHLEQLASPPTPEQQEKLTWGNRFHKLMQQRELGLPIESLSQEDEQFYQAINALLEAAPEAFNSATSSWREAEHCRTLEMEGYLLTVIYDLLVAQEQEAKIFDWKTYLRPENQRVIAQNWQTRLYMYVLAETSPYSPEQISLTYWFVQSPLVVSGVEQKTPQSLTFRYSTSQHEQTRQDLHGIFTQLGKWWEDYQQQSIFFPQVPETKGECNYCNFADRCQRTPGRKEELRAGDWLTAVEEIEEIAL